MAGAHPGNLLNPVLSVGPMPAAGPSSSSAVANWLRERPRRFLSSGAIRITRRCDFLYPDLGSVLLHLKSLFQHGRLPETISERLHRFQNRAFMQLQSVTCVGPRPDYTNLWNRRRFTFKVHRLIVWKAEGTDCAAEG